ncbi:DUF3900 domain-containing protein [Bacillus changyiensis]|uniref:DUF3900 domain-containing protein n=1 Tax=Bacillus changyiensis TaxID=3004103 RepID=UPI0022E7E295|nr:DUF3900 domain-containing protein [Bacillus changyiensis]MDA1477953.1 DUF3900 domain-containing protein [Bacillus changyiensis]
MDFEIRFISFYVIQVDGKDEQANKQFKHFQTLDTTEFEHSELKDFLDGELKKIVKRKAERHPKSEQVPTKIGRFITEPGHALDSNPNYNLFHRTKEATTKEDFIELSEQFVHTYLDTSAVRGGVFLVASAVPRKYFDDAFVFVMKCDFEPKVASIADEASLIQKVEMAITTKNMKSIQYPYMPEEGMTEESEVKIHQSSHARYFEDFLKFVEYGESMPQIMKTQVMNMVQEHVYETFSDTSEERQQFEHDLEIWEASEKRDIQERLDTHQVIEAAAQMIEHVPEAELKMKLGETEIKGPLAGFGDTIHLAKVNGRYVALIEAETISFEKGSSPVEFYKPEGLHQVIERMTKRNSEA